MKKLVAWCGFSVLIIFALLIAGTVEVDAGALTGKNIVCSPGHGWVWNSTLTRWATERGEAQLGMIEDLNNYCIARHVKTYLEDAGAGLHWVRDMSSKNSDKYTGKGPDPSTVTIAANYPWWQISSRYYFYVNRSSENVPATVYSASWASGESSKSLRSRTYYANWKRKEFNKCDLYLSMHSNATSSASSRGVVVLCDNDNNSTDASDYDGGDFNEHTSNITNSYNFAKALAAKQLSIMKTYYDSGWKTTYNALGVWQANWKWWEVRGVQKPSALIEYGFHTNLDDTKALTDEKGRRLLAQATYKGICDYLGITDYELPSTITDLKANTGTAIGTVKIIWTAPGEDGTMQPAKTYVVKYSTSVIDTKTKFNAATTYTQTWVPKKRYAREEYVLSNLTAGVTYYFCVQSKNDTADSSKISNSPSAPAQATAGTGLPTCSVNGTVKDLITKSPISGVSVVVAPDNLTATTGTDGMYSIIGLEGGDYTVSVTVNGYNTESSTFTGVVNTTSTVDFELVVSTYATLWGYLTDKNTGAPVYNAKCQLSGANNISVYSNIDGWYGFGGLAAGGCYLVVTVAGYQTFSQIITLTTGQETRINVILQPYGAGISKGVIVAAVRDASTRAALNGAACLLSPEMTQLVTDASGDARFENLVIGSHTVTVSLGGYKVVVSTCNLTSGATVQLEFAMSPKTGAVGGRVYGTIYDETGLSTIPGAECVLNPGELKTTSDDNGNYEFIDLSTGDYIVSVSKYGYRTSSDTITLESESVELRVNLTEAKGSTLSGRFLDKTSNTGISGLTVTLTKNNVVMIAVTDTDGRFMVSNVRTAGYWQVEVNNMGYKAFSKSVYIELGAQVEINNELEPNESLSNVTLSARVYTPTTTDGVKKDLQIKFNLPVSAGGSPAVKVVIYDIKGRLVKEVSRLSSAASEVTVLWDGTDMSDRAVGSGVYFYQIQYEGKTRSGQVVVAK
ncbi:MAG: carboxypeptidase regulatory-like domain-containing protein [Elusimicrobiota bacterium]